MAGFGGPLAVVRVQLLHDTSVATLPGPRSQADEYAASLVSSVERAGVTAELIRFDSAEGRCWIRARDVQLVEVLPTEDPGA